MLSLDFVCQHPEIVREALRRRHDAQSIDEILRMSEQRRGLITRNDGLYAALKSLKESVRTASAEKRVTLNQRIKTMIKDIRQLELQISDINTRLQLQVRSLPNMPHKSVKEGSGPDDRPILHTWGDQLSFYFEPLPHWQLGEHLGIIDAEGGVKVAGSRFVVLRGMGARLERALISYMLDLHTREHGYSEVIPPYLVRRSVMQGAGQLPKFEDQSYICDDELYLNPTAEVPLVGLYSDTQLEEEELPIRCVAWTTAFRREAGSASHQMRGLMRLHQFNKVELFQLVKPMNSYTVLQEMVYHAETVLQQLELHYRVVELHAADLPFAASKTIDLEVWMPAQRRYVEISSVSNCEDFQAERSNIKYSVATHNQRGYVHTLNGSGLAVGRTMAAILETYQQADGSVIVPKVLRPYVASAVIRPPIK